MKEKRLLTILTDSLLKSPAIFCTFIHQSNYDKNPLRISSKSTAASESQHFNCSV